MSNLDTFAKVRALHDRTNNAGERAAAASRMEKLARKAGMSVSEALSKLDTPAPKSQAQAATNAFNDFFNTPEFHAERAERERKRLDRCAILLKQYGSEDAVFADTEREAALRDACAPLVVWDTRPEWSGSYDLGGWGSMGSRDKLPAAVREAVSKSWPLPETVAQAWAEFEAAEALEGDRCAFVPEYTPHSWVEARRYVLEDILDTTPARSLNDLRARLSWMEFLHGLQAQWSHDRDGLRLATLRADIERMGARLKGESAPVQNGQSKGMAETTIPSRRTNAEKRADVLALLDADKNGSHLTDREIARRVGVSPQTVNTWRKKANLSPGVA